MPRTVLQASFFQYLYKRTTYTVQPVVLPWEAKVSFKDISGQILEVLLALCLLKGDVHGLKLQAYLQFSTALRRPRSLQKMLLNILNNIDGVNYELLRVPTSVFYLSLLFGIYLLACHSELTSVEKIAPCCFIKEPHPSILTM